MNHENQYITSQLRRRMSIFQRKRIGINKLPDVGAFDFRSYVACSGLVVLSRRVYSIQAGDFFAGLSLSHCCFQPSHGCVENVPAAGGVVAVH